MYAREEGAFDVEGYLGAMGMGGASLTEQGRFLAEKLGEMALKRSAFESFVGHPIMRYLYSKMSQSPQSVDDRTFISLLNNIRNRDYARNSAMISLARQVATTTKLQFDLPMFFKCLLGSILTFMLALCSYTLLHMLCKTGMVIMLSVGIFIFIILVVIAFALIPREKNRYNR